MPVRGRLGPVLSPACAELLVDRLQAVRLGSDAEVVGVGAVGEFGEGDVESVAGGDEVVRG